MKKYLFISFLTAILFSHSQVAPPQAFNYSAIARNSAGVPIDSQNIGLQFTILKGSTNGAIQYQENQFTTTNLFGLFDVVLGTGQVQQGTFSSVNWSNDLYFLRVGLDVTGGTNFKAMGTTQFLSVPYCLYADSAGHANNGTGTGSNPATQLYTIDGY